MFKIAFGSISKQISSSHFIKHEGVWWNINDAEFVVVIS